MKNNKFLIAVILIVTILFANVVITTELSYAAAQTKEEFKGYTLIEVDGGDISGIRKPNVVVDIGFGDREYYAFTNKYGQLVKVIAKEIILQDATKEKVLENGRYYKDEAKVPGTEKPDYDEGHIIADSLGGVANAYNITPQNSTLNRHGNQAYMEKIIRDTGGCKDFIAIITYPDTKTQIPSSYKYTYTINVKGKTQTNIDEFKNVNPDKENAKIINSENIDEKSELKKIDKNNNGIVTIKEAEDAGYKMPIKKDHWLYKYMIDKDNDGMVGE